MDDKSFCLKLEGWTCSVELETRNDFVCVGLPARLAPQEAVAMVTGLMTACDRFGICNRVNWGMTGKEYNNHINCK